MKQGKRLKAKGSSGKPFILQPMFLSAFCLFMLMVIKNISTKILLGIFLLFQSNALTAWELSGYAGMESLGFFQEGVDSQQHNHYLSGVIQPQLVHEWDDGRQNFAFVPFYRLSQYDNRRTHFDIRELNWLKAADTWELRVGFRQVFWGVTESQHLVDIVNQKDLVENLDGEDKLGQPMVNLALIQEWGTLDLFVLPGFRERTFSGQEGRFRFDPALDVYDSLYEKKGAERQMAYAIRWSNAIGDWDWGLSQFYGTNRDPSFLATLDLSGNLHLTPYYESIYQTGLDLQVTKGRWLWKLESVVRSGQGKTYYAGTGGVEYTFNGIFETSLDLGLLAEYMYDSRGQRTINTLNQPNQLVFFQDDFFAAIRLSFNDEQSTEILAGVTFDRTTGEKLYNLEASRRLGENFKLELELRLFNNASSNDPTYFLRNDDSIRTELSYHF